MINTKKLLAGALACLMLALPLAGCGKKDAAAERPVVSGTPVETVQVETGAMAAESAISGTVVAKTAVQVFPLMAGTVTELAVKAGDSVSKGQLLFKVDVSAVTSSYDALQASYQATRQATDQAIAGAKLQVEQAKVGVEQATTAAENARAMHEVGAVSDQQLTQAEQGLRQAQTGLAQAQAGVEQAQASQKASLAQIEASLSQIESQANLGTVTAPVGGYVSAVNIDRGGMAAQTAPAVIIAADGILETAVSVSETVLAGLHPGDAARLILPSVSAEPIESTIVSIGSAANPQTMLYDVRLSLPADAKPPIGAFADVTLFTDHRANAVRIPTEALLTDGINQYVYILSDKAPAQDEESPAEGDAPALHTAHKVLVKTGLIGDGVTEIIEGLTGGETLVIKGQSYLSDGADARIVPAEADA